MQCSIKKGTRFEMRGKVFEIVQHQQLAKQYLFENEAGIQSHLQEEELHKLFHNGELAFVPETVSNVRATSTKRPYATYTTEELGVAYRRLNYLTACMNKSEKLIQGDSNLARTINSYARSIDEKGNIPSPKTIKNWFYRWKHRGERLEALIPGHSKKGNRESPFPDEVLAIVWHLIESFYLNKQKRSIKALHEEIAKTMDEDELYAGMPCPSYSTIARIVDSIPEYTKVLHRMGYSVAQRRFPTGLPVNEPAFFMAEVEVDHTPIDCDGVDPETGEPIGRIWLTTVLERMSRVVLGFYIARRAPSSLSVLLAIEHAIRDKSYVKEEYPQIQNDWPCWGLFWKMSVDNGSDLHANRVKAAMNHLGIEVNFNPPGHPQRKGRVERFGKSANALFHAMPGATFSNYIAKGEYKSKKHACLSVADITEIFHIWLIDIYHQTPHRALGESPMSRWKKEELVSGARRMPTDAEQFRKMFWTEYTRMINTYGIEYKRLRYYSPELMNIAKRDGWEDLEVTTFVDPEDLSEIRVKDPKTEELITVPCSQRNYVSDGISEVEHEAVLKQLRANGTKGSSSNFTEAAYMATKAMIDAKVAAAKKATTKARRLAANNISQTSSAVIAGISPEGRNRGSKSTSTPAVLPSTTVFESFNYQETPTDD